MDNIEKTCDELINGLLFQKNQNEFQKMYQDENYRKWFSIFALNFIKKVKKNFETVQYFSESNIGKKLTFHIPNNTSQFQESNKKIIFVGRDDFKNDIVCYGNIFKKDITINVSRIHCIIVQTVDKLYIVDIGSAPGIISLSRSSNKPLVKSIIGDRNLLEFDIDETIVILCAGCILTINPQKCTNCLNKHKKKIQFLPHLYTEIDELKMIQKKYELASKENEFEQLNSKYKKFVIKKCCHFK